jgi:PRTRC genetic system protein E
MTFFKNMSDKLQDGVPMKLVIAKNKNRLAVSVIPDVNDDNVVPAIISGTPEELEQSFFAALGNAIEVTGIHLSDKMLKGDKNAKKEDNKKAAPEAEQKTIGEESKAEEPAKVTDPIEDDSSELKEGESVENVTKEETEEKHPFDSVSEEKKEENSESSEQNVEQPKNPAEESGDEFGNDEW